MKLKLKLMAAAVALAASAGANAAIQNASGSLNGNSEGFFTAYGNGVAYTFDLAQPGFNSAFGTDTRLNNLVTNTDSVLINSTSIESLATASNGIIYDLALPSFNDFLAQANTANSNIQFNVTFADSVGTQRVLTTLESPLGPVPNLSTGLAQGLTNINTYIAAVNGKMTLNGSATSSVLTDGWAITVPTDLNAYGGLYADNYGTFPGFDDTGVLGGSINMAVMYGSPTVPTLMKAFTMGGNVVTASTYLATDNQWHLQVAALAPIPEPSEYALMLAGLGMLGFIARRRLANRG